MDIDRFGSVPAIVQCLRPKGWGWTEEEAHLPNSPFPARAFRHHHGFFVISAVEVMDEIPSKGPEYHLSMSRHSKAGAVRRCDSNDARWILEQFGLDGAEEDNHVPFGKVRNFWRPVADPLVGLECECKAAEPAIVEDKGDFIWRDAPHGR